LFTILAVTATYRGRLVLQVYMLSAESFRSFVLEEAAPGLGGTFF
jgi:hypothetical protein